MYRATSDKQVYNQQVVLGIVMSVAILDHTRLFFHFWNTNPADLEHTTPALFFTRFVSHYFAPAVFLLTGIGLYRKCLSKTIQQGAGSMALAGLLLLLTEATVNNFLYTFDPCYRTLGLFILGALGASLLLLAALQFLPLSMLRILAVAVLLGHNLLDGPELRETFGQTAAWAILHRQRFFPAGDHLYIINYTLLPWAALLALGYGCGPYFLSAFNARIRKRRLLAGGMLLTLAFFVLRWSNLYGDPHPWNAFPDGSRSLMSFFNVTKYPASLAYLCITVGPLMCLYALLEGRRNRITGFFAAFGALPLSMYLFSTFVIHLVSMAALPLSGISWQHMIITPASYRPDSPLAGYGYPLGAVYLLWAILMAGLYFLSALLLRRRAGPG